MEENNITACEKFIDELHELQKCQTSQNSKFFYSNDKFIDTFDDKQLYKSIINKYPQFKLIGTTDSNNRKVLVQMLDDTVFINEILTKYNINIHDFFVFIYRIYPSMFNGLFVKKIQKTIENKNYAKKIKYSNYKHARPTKKSRRFKL